MSKEENTREIYEKKAHFATNRFLCCKDCFWYKDCEFGNGSRSPYDCCGCNAVVFFEGYIQALLDVKADR